MEKLRLKKGLAMFVVFCLLFTCSGVTAFAAEGDGKKEQIEKQIWLEKRDDAGSKHDLEKIQTYYDLDASTGAIKEGTHTSSAIVTTEGGFVEVAKKISPTGTENLFNIELQVATKEEITTSVAMENAAVILVMDMSGSMNDRIDGKGSRIRKDAAKDAAKKFLDQYGQNAQGAERWLSLVEFGSQAYTLLPWTDLAQSGTAGAIQKISAMNPGFAYSYQGLVEYRKWVADGTEKCDGRWWHSHPVGIDPADDSQLLYVNIEKTCQKNTWINKYKQVDAVRQGTGTGNGELGTNIEGALLLANNLLVDGKKNQLKEIDSVYVILLSDGEPTFHVSENQEMFFEGSTYFIPGTEGGGSQTTYEDHRDITDLNDFRGITTSGDNLAAKIKERATLWTISFASGDDRMTLSESGRWADSAEVKIKDWLAHFADKNYDSKSDIDLTFKDIAQTITNFAKAWIVEDPMGEYVTYVGPGEGQSAIPEDPADRSYAKYITSEKKLYWNLPLDDYNKRGDRYEYRLKYQVKLNTEKAGFMQGELYPTNGKTTLSYMMQEDGQPVGDLKYVDFRIPAVHGYLGTEEIKKKDSVTKEVISGANFDLTVTGAGISMLPLTASSDTNGVATFNKIPSGYQYELRETYPNGALTGANGKKYLPYEDKHLVTVAYGKVTIEGLLNDKNIIWNEPDPENKELQIVKVWKEEPTKHDSITIKITNSAIGEGALDETFVIEKDDCDVVEGKKDADPSKIVYQQWTYTLPDEYPSKDGNGNGITYKITETDIDGKGLDNYSYTVSADNESATEGTLRYRIVNTLKDDIDFSATKEWVGPENLLPDSIQISLQRAAYGSGVYTPIETKTLTKASGWADADFGELPLFDDNGLPYSYRVTEAAITGFTPILPSDHTSGVFAVKNVVSQEWITISGTKTWNDGGISSGRPDEITLGLYDESDKRIQTTTTSAVKGWQYTFADAVKKYDITVSGETITGDGHEISYSVKEETNVSGYSSAPGTGYGVVNTRTGEISISVEKVWVAPEEETPGFVEVTLQKKLVSEADSAYADVETLTLGAIQTGIDPEGDPIEETYGWERDFSDQPQFDEQGVAYSYRVVEKNVPAGFTAKVTQESEGGDIAFTVTNTIGGKFTINGTKTWNDSEDFDGVRPDSVTIGVYRNNDLVESETVSDPWTYSFTLEKYIDGEDVSDEYVVKEIDVDENYTASEGTAGETVQNIVNTIKPGTTSVGGIKSWIDGNDALGHRLDEVTIGLYDGPDTTGEPVKQVTTDAAKEWAYSFTELPKYKNGVRIIYSVKEIGTDSRYTGNVTVSGNGYDKNANEWVYNIENTLTWKTVDLPAKKVWNDGSDRLGERPESILLVLYSKDQNGNLERVNIDDVENPVTLTGQGDEWTHTFEGLPQYSADYTKEYSYYVDEEAVEGDTKLAAYTKDLSLSGAGIVANTLEIDSAEIVVTKSWVGPKDTLPEIEVTLMRSTDGQTFAAVPGVDSVTMTSSKAIENDPLTWKHNFGELPLYEETTYLPYTYQAVEEEVSGYDFVRVSNLHLKNIVQQDEVVIFGEKAWEMGESGLSVPETLIDIELYADGQPTGLKQNVGAEGDWTFTFPTQPKYDLAEDTEGNVIGDGHEIVYSVREVGESGNIVNIDKSRFNVSYSKDAEKGYIVENAYAGTYSYQLVVNYITYESDGRTIHSQASTSFGPTPGAFQFVFKVDNYDGYKTYGGNEYEFSSASDGGNGVTLIQPGEVYQITLTYIRVLDEEPADPDPGDPDRPHVTPRTPETPPTTPIDDEVVPLADLPVLKPDVVIPEPGVPLADIPQTGVDGNMVFNLMMLGISLSALLAVLFARKRTIKATDGNKTDCA